MVLGGLLKHEPDRGVQAETAFAVQTAPQRVCCVAQTVLQRVCCGSFWVLLGMHARGLQELLVLVLVVVNSVVLGRLQLLQVV